MELDYNVILRSLKTNGGYGCHELFALFISFRFFLNSLSCHMAFTEDQYFLGNPLMLYRTTEIIDYFPSASWCLPSLILLVHSALERCGWPTSATSATSCYLKLNLSWIICNFDYPGSMIFIQKFPIHLGNKKVPALPIRQCMFM